MSLHVVYDHQCSKCKAYYIPYEEGVVCPNCGLDENEVYNITLQLVDFANYQMLKHGFYTPIVWWTGSLGDHVTYLIFKVLDIFYAQEENNFEEVAEEHFNSNNWGAQQYMKNHIRDLSYKVYLEIEKQKEETQ